MVKGGPGWGVAVEVGEEEAFKDAAMDLGQRHGTRLVDVHPGGLGQEVDGGVVPGRGRDAQAVKGAEEKG
jgi:hypothetical protein